MSIPCAWCRWPCEDLGHCHLAEVEEQALKEWEAQEGEL